MQLPPHAATSMLCKCSMMTNAWQTNAACTTATYSVVYCTTHYAAAAQHDATHVIPTITYTTQCNATN